MKNPLTILPSVHVKDAVESCDKALEGLRALRIQGRGPLTLVRAELEKIQEQLEARFQRTDFHRVLPKHYHEQAVKSKPVEAEDGN